MANLRREFKHLSSLAMPIIGANLGTMLMGTVDTLMVGRVGEEALAAVALGTAWIGATLFLAQGVVFGVDPIVSQAHGAGDGARAGRALQSGIVIALLLSLPLMVAWWYTADALRIVLHQEQQARMVALAAQYVRVQIPCIPCFLVFTALRQYLQGRGIVRPALLIILAANLVNVLGNWLLIFGKFGLPAQGAVGAGIATAITRSFLLFGLAALTLRLRLHAGAWVAWSKAACSLRRLAEVARYGLPTGLQMALEVWAFGLTTVLAGRLGETATAAHTIVLNLASLSFMVPLGISGAATTRVGNLLGAQDRQGAQRAAWVALTLGATTMSAFALCFALFRAQLPRFYTGEGAVLLLASSILPIAAAFQVFDGLQVVGAGILRGTGRTLPAALFNLLAYYALALPVGWWLAFEQGLGLLGLWWGLAIGLCLVALALLMYVQQAGPARYSARPPVP